MKAEFLAEMTHELRSPLNTILGFAELMHDGTVGPISDEHKEYLGDILTSGRHLLRMIDDVLDLAKLEAGRATNGVEVVDLAAVVDGACSLVQGRAAHRDIRIRIEIAAMTDIVLDPIYVKQIAYDALANAVNCTRDGGTIVVRARPEGDDFELVVEGLDRNQVRTARFTALLTRTVAAS